MRQRGLIFILTTACMFGLGTVLARIMGQAFNPIFVSWLALLCGGFCVSICQLLRRKPLLPRHFGAVDWIDLLLFASLGTALPLVCVVLGLARTSAITGSFLLQLQSPVAIVLALFFLKEKLAWRQVGGIALLLAGSVLIILRNVQGPLQIEGGLGDLLVLIAALGLGFSYIPGKRLAARGDALQIILLRLIIGSFLLLPLLAFQPGVLLAPLAWSTVGFFALYIVSNFGVGYILQQMGLGLLQAWESAALMQTLPLFSTVFAVLLLQESPTLLQIIGGGIILSGGVLTIGWNSSRF